MSDLLCARALTKKYGGVTALDDFTLTLTGGKIVGLLGPNGSGKTTLIKLAAGMLKPTRGEILIEGEAPCAATKAKVAYLPDHIFLDPRLTVGQTVAYFTDFFADFRPSLALEMLTKLGLKESDRVKSLSKGNKEKVCLILTMSRNASLYLLDEPIAGVDPATRDYIISTIIRNYNPASAVVISTHLIADIEAVLDEVIFIRAGKLLLQQETDALRAETGKSVDEVFREVFKW